MKDKKNAIVHLVSFGILCAGFVLTRYIFFDIHGMKQLPLILFLCGIAAIGIAFLAKAKRVSVLTALAYIIGFTAGAIFRTDGVDAGGGRTNNLWIIWMVVFVSFIVAAVIMEIIAARKKKSNPET